MSLVLFHNPNCSKSRAACEILQVSPLTFQVRNYLTDPPSEIELDGLLKMLGLQPIEIVRTGEEIYETLKLGEKGKTFSRAQWIAVLVQNPILIERPILWDGQSAVVGRPPERIQAFIDQRIKKVILSNTEP